MIAFWLSSLALGAPVTADEVVAAALARDPDLARAEAARDAATGARKAATGFRYDPTLDARVGFGVPQHEASLTQPLSLTGEGLAAAKSAGAALRAAEADLDRRTLEVAAAARRLLIQAIAADAEVARSGEVLRFASELRAASESRLATGGAAEIDVHFARLDQAAAAADLVRARRSSLALREQLAATTGLGSEVELPGDPMLAAPTGSAGGERADLRAAEARAESADAALRRERAAALPPLELGVWAQLPPDGLAAPLDQWSIGPTASVTLPIWNGNRAGVAEARGERQVARAELAAIDARIAAEQAGSVARRTAVEAVAGTADPAPEARASLAGVDAAMNAGELSAAEAALLRSRVLDAWRRASGARAEAAEVAVDLALAEGWPGLLPQRP